MRPKKANPSAKQGGCENRGPRLHVKRGVVVRDSVARHLRIVRVLWGLLGFIAAVSLDIWAPRQRGAKTTTWEQVERRRIGALASPVTGTRLGMREASSLYSRACDSLFVYYLVHSYILIAHSCVLLKIRESNHRALFEGLAAAAERAPPAWAAAWCRPRARRARAAPP